MEIVLGMHEPWEFGWDALVAIGTLALAFVTVIAVAIPLVIERQRLRGREAHRKKEASYMAMAFDHELHMAQGLATVVVREVRRNWRSNIREAMDAAPQGFGRIETPLLIKFAARVNRFDGDTATATLVALSRILQAKAAATSRPDIQITREQAWFTCKTYVRTAILVIRDVRAARLQLSAYRAPNITIVKPGRRYRGGFVR